MVEQWIEGEYRFLGFFDGLSILVWLIILIFLVSSKKNAYKGIDYYKYYVPAFYFKLLAALGFSIIYIRNYQGGDSTAYWDTAQKLQQLFFDSPSKFFDELFIQGPYRERYVNFDYKTIGLPPNWIYKEDQAYFVAKIMSLLSFITFRSYFAMTIICSYISFRASWMLFEFAVKNKISTVRNLAIGTLFLPSTAFWCTGISKDMVIYSCVMYILVSLLKMITEKSEKSKIIVFFKIFVCMFLIIHIRNFMLVPIIAPIFYLLGVRWSNLQKSGGSRFFIRFLFLSVIGVGIFLFFQSESAVTFATEAKMVQTDLQNNQDYGDNRYDLGLTDFSPIGMIKAMPISIYTAFYRPYIWEANSTFILISALETLVFFLLTLFSIINFSFIRNFRFIAKNEILLFSLGFSIILGFFAGYTAGLFGVLVRFKAPLLPFLFIILTINPTKDEIEV